MEVSQAVHSYTSHNSQPTDHCLHRWWALPEVGLGPQAELLASFQRLVELQESTRIIVDLSTPRAADYHHSDLRVRGLLTFFFAY